MIPVFKALSDPNRIRIVGMISEKKMCVCEITAILGLATSTVSKHLSILREAGLIIDEKSGKWVNYHLNTSMDSEYIQHLLFLMKSWLRDSEVAIEDRRAAQNVNRNQLCR